MTFVVLLMDGYVHKKLLTSIVIKFFFVISSKTYSVLTFVTRVQVLFFKFYYFLLKSRCFLYKKTQNALKRKIGRTVYGHVRKSRCFLRPPSAIFIVPQNYASSSFP